MDLVKDFLQISEKLKENGQYLTEIEDKLLIMVMENKLMDIILFILPDKIHNIFILII
jgi:hypothetical protein